MAESNCSSDALICSNIPSNADALASMVGQIDLVGILAHGDQRRLYRTKASCRETVLGGQYRDAQGNTVSSTKEGPWVPSAE